MQVYDLYEIQDLLNDDAISEICTSGSNDAATNKYAIELKDKIRVNDYLIDQISEYIGDDALEFDYHTLRQYAIWIAAWDKFENQEVENGL